MDEHYSQAQLAWRMVIELVAGLGIGFGMGYGLDWLFGTSPWLMIVFIFLGLAAGIQTMMRSAREVQASKWPKLRPVTTRGRKTWQLRQKVAVFPLTR